MKLRPTTYWELVERCSACLQNVLLQAEYHFSKINCRIQIFPKLAYDADKHKTNIYVCKC